MLFNGTDTGAPLKHALLSYNISDDLSIHIFGKIAKNTKKRYCSRSRQKVEEVMIGKYKMRTDLAMENQEKFERDHVEISGVEIEKKKRKAEIQTTIVKITSDHGAKMMGKPKGTYVTIEAPLLLTADEAESQKAAEEFTRCLCGLLPETYGSVLVVGLGNRSITADALGPETVEQLIVTRHLVRAYGKEGCEVSALTPGVMAQTGMEAVEILCGTAEQTKPDVILAVDALAACSIHRLNCTIQITDTGIWPGSGVGNHRNALNKETIGVPVIGIGAPTVVGAGTIVHDAVAGVLESLEESEMDEFLGEVISPALESLYVTTKEIDEMVHRLAGVLAAGLNQAFSEEK